VPIPRNFLVKKLEPRIDFLFKKIVYWLAGRWRSKDREMDLAKELGAVEDVSTQKLCLYIPDKDKVGGEIRGHDEWVKAARELLSQIGGGATALPPADGTWEMETGEILWERTRLIYCFIDPDLFEANIKKLRGFLHRFGRETNQGEVVVEFDGRFLRIRAFDHQTG
jgi:hypothetical protein